MDSETREKLLKAGKIASQVRREGAVKLKVVGASYLEIMDYCEKRIVELDGQLAWAQMSVDHIAAHFCPVEDEKAVTELGQLIKIDIGVHIDGWIADTAMTIECGDSNKHAKLIEASQNGLREAIKKVKSGVAISELGAAQMDEAKKLGFTTIKNLSGHSIDQYTVHAGISIPSFDTGEQTQLAEGMHIAIEPFVTNGEGYVKNEGKSTIFMLRGNVSVRSPYARKILEFVKPLNGVPFTTRHITRKFSRGVYALGMKELLKNSNCESYPPLAERTGGMVAQFEHSMIVTKDGCEVYTRHADDTW
ncbi:type II methionyl aminopeptidase [archaeon]|jgi:methionyl aminopeptidase|nr:type II methionyl aminopeptidase [archaeon]MBT6762439.1 type II methionyl aminopeptidase [archaeon]